MGSYKGISRNLRRENIDAGDIQGNPGLLVKSSVKEGNAPASNKIGIPFQAVCLFSFKIADSAANVPDLLTVSRHQASGDASVQENNLRQGLFRVACRAMPAFLLDTNSTTNQLSDDVIPPNPMKAKTKEEYFRLAKNFPIYVGDYLDNITGDLPPGTSMGGEVIPPGYPLEVRDNDHRGGIYGTILSSIDLPTGFPPMQFAPGPIRELFGGGEGPFTGTIGPLNDSILEQYRVQDPPWWTLSQIIDRSQPWSPLDAAESIYGSGQRTYSDGPVGTDTPVPELQEGWSLIQRWKNLNLGTDSNDYQDDSVAGNSRGHSYLIKRTGDRYVVYDSATSRGYKTNSIDWGGTQGSGNVVGYIIGAQHLPSFNPEDTLANTSKFMEWVSGARLPCVTFTACLLREVNNPGQVSFDEEAIS